MICRSSSRSLRRSSTASVPFLPSMVLAFSAPVYFDGSKETSSSSPRSERIGWIRKDSEPAEMLSSSWRPCQWPRTDVCWAWPWSWEIDDFRNRVSKHPSIILCTDAELWVVNLIYLLYLIVDCLCTSFDVLARWTLYYHHNYFDANILSKLHVMMVMIESFEIIQIGFRCSEADFYYGSGYRSTPAPPHQITT